MAEMRLPAPARAFAWRTGRRFVDWSAGRLKLASYVPLYDYREQLDLHTAYTADSRAVRDKRASTVDERDVDLTLTIEGLEDVLRDRDWTGKRVLEVGPKHGTHALWIDEHLRPSELVFSDFEADRHLHEKWEPRLRAPHRWVYGDLRSASELATIEPFDVVFFLGVLYHSAFHLPLLGMLNRVTRPGGEMLLETTIDPRPDAAVRIRWQRGTGKAKAVPTLDALRIELAWTGWRDVTHYTDYRPGSSEVLLLCRKTDELSDGADVVDVVAPQRPSAGA
jgi:SAM-dependent methyltransferase